MFESLLSRYENPYRGAAVSTAIFTAFALFLADRAAGLQLVSTDFEGVLAVLLVTVGLSYPLISYIRERDEEELQETWSETRLVERHLTEIGVYATVFFTAALIFAIGYQLLPASFFTAQDTAIAAITGNATASTGFYSILPNNLMVAVATFVLSFFLMGGLIFVLIWNASVLGAHVGGLAETMLHIPVRTLPYVAHGFLEVSGFALAGIAGTLLSMQVEHFYLRETHGRQKFLRASLDAALLLGLSIVVIVLAAVIETGYPFTA